MNDKHIQWALFLIGSFAVSTASLMSIGAAVIAGAGGALIGVVVGDAR